MSDVNHGAELLATLNSISCCAGHVPSAVIATAFERAEAIIAELESIRHSFNLLAADRDRIIAERDAAVARAERAEAERDAWKERAKRRAALIRDMHELVAFRVGDPLTPRALAVLDAALADESLKEEP